MSNSGAAWEPPELKLRPGDRVEVRLSGECHFNRFHDGAADAFQRANNRARILEVLTYGYDFERGHPYFVLIETPGGFATEFSRSELRLIERGTG